MGNFQSYKQHKEMYKLLRNNYRISNYLRNNDSTLYKAYKEKSFCSTFVDHLLTVPFR